MNRKTNETIKIRTSEINPFYVYELRGVCFLTWVNEVDISQAMIFPKEEIKKWVDVLSSFAKSDLIAVYYPSGEIVEI